MTPDSWVYILNYVRSQTVWRSVFQSSAHCMNHPCIYVSHSHTIQYSELYGSCTQPGTMTTLGCPLTAVRMDRMRGLAWAGLFIFYWGSHIFGCFGNRTSHAHGDIVWINMGRYFLVHGNLHYYWLPPQFRKILNDVSNIKSLILPKKLAPLSDWLITR